MQATYFRQVLPHVRGFPTLRVLRLIRLPNGMRRAFPFTVLLRLPAPGSSHPRSGSGLAPCPGFPLRASISVCHTSTLPTAGAVGASRVLRRISSCMPRPEDSGGPPHPRQHGCFVLPSGTLKPSASATSYFEAVPALQGARSPLRPTGFSVYASPVLFAAPSWLRHRRKTRYGRVASPYPAGTLTLQDTPSLSWRDNVRVQGAAAAATPLLRLPWNAMLGVSPTGMIGEALLLHRLRLRNPR